MHDSSMIRTPLAAAALLLAALPAAQLSTAAPATPPAANAQPADFAKLSPFTTLSVRQTDPEVVVDVTFEGQPYELLALDGTPIAEVWQHCRAHFASRAEKRLAEDIVEVLHGLGSPNATTVDLELRAPDGTVRKVAEAPMTAANRDAVWTARNRVGGPVPKVIVARVEREHAAHPAEPFAWLAEPRTGGAWDDGTWIDGDLLAADLDQLEHHITHEYSYAELTGVDYHAALDAARLGLQGGASLRTFATRVAEVMALFGDGHSAPRGLTALRTPGYLPFLVADTAEGPVALRPDRSGFVDPENPFLVSLDGRPLDEWLAVAARTRAAGSRQFVRRHALRSLRMIAALRAEAGWPVSDEVSFTLAPARHDDEDWRDASAPLTMDYPLYGSWPPATGADVLDGGVGYLRIPSMTSDAGELAGFEAALRGFAANDARTGVVLDVRGNGGGSRDALRRLLPFFMDPDRGPQVVNVGALRLSPERKALPTPPSGYLENRALYPADAAHWTPEDQIALVATAAAFLPDWPLDPEAFSAWHYMVVAPSSDLHIDVPVAVLMDTGCFSATDIFLGAFAAATDATLVGTPSGGGSGRTQRVRLAHSGLEVRLSTMASFRPNGKRYDGKGIAPDVLVEPAPTDLLLDGGDAQLARALEQIAKQR